MEQKGTRDLILDATDRLMARYGFRKTTVEDVANEAGFGRRTIYTYFKSKEELGLASIARVVNNTIDRCRAISEEPVAPKAKLRRILTERVMGRVLAVQDYHQSLDDLFEVVRPKYMARRKEFFDQERDLIAMVLCDGLEAGEFLFEDSQATAHSLLLATNAFLPYSLSVRDLGRPEEIERRLTQLVAILIRGVSSPTHQSL